MGLYLHFSFRGDPVVLVKCIDCKLIMGVVQGEKEEVKYSFSLCERCMGKRNGFKGAKSPQELGTF